MKIWLCPQAKTCPFTGEIFCGHGDEKPILFSYHPEAPITAECYVDHIINCWEEWLKIRSRWSRSVKRVLESVLGVHLSERNFQWIMGFIILHHDVGKLTKEYQNKKFFRHEALSSYILYRWLEMSGFEGGKADLLAAVFAAAVYLHHEGLQIAHEHFEMREPTYSYLLNWLSGIEFNMVEVWDELMRQISQEYTPISTPTYSIFSQKPIAGFEVANVLGSIVTSVDGCAEPLAMRMAIAAVLHPLTICDNRAASKRGGMPSTISRALAKFFEEGAIAEGEE
jgi:CRISPR-associated endonuclease Cas3-HD